jgi:hypothetical protein
VEATCLTYVKEADAEKIVQLPEIFQRYDSGFSTNGKTGVMYVNQFR